MNQDTARIIFKVTTQQLRQLKERIMMQDPAAVPIENLLPSSHDCLVAFIITVLNRHLNTPITRVANAASVRTVSIVSGVVEDGIAGNAIYIIPTSIAAEDIHDLKRIAYALRRSILSWRERSKVEEYMSVASHFMQLATNQGHSMFFAAPPGHMSVNSNAGSVVMTAGVRLGLALTNIIRIDWHSAHFGLPNKIKFHTSGINDRYVRVFSSNPTTSGEEEPSPSLDVSFAMASSIQEEVYNDIMSVLQAQNFPDNIL
ncbi:hypothetical protein BD309DRAFT_849867 [Dichomitus squalens]|uniref:Uncharacterized protein n=1 Tax=Dichomitus squalens TaxID=114155 RepID=A0A4V2K5X6_9APHY|nr:hypothetical protein BD309DRAFT_849867 [Dichomitus squalens]TBU66173.1 hypothetical protein BD310DRAFT_803558 [Dichomitus squalens]